MTPTSGAQANVTPSTNAPSPDSLAQTAARFKGPAPVHLWNPPFCGDIDMEIRADGTWFYQGTPIGRAPLVRLFGSILKREGDRYFLVTPHEKVGIRVEDAPFVAVDAEAGPAGLTFTTNLGEEVLAGPEHPLRLAGTDAAPRPYVMVRAGLEALIDRKTFYRLVEIAEPEDVDGRQMLGLRSGGAFFPLIAMQALAER
ncbi:DUF1285 domain-containing protein [Phaeovulum vinaykumarii]|uniref:DUF1285 domain-containing protein n=1 Tax=Phaeovulum vinaykumarii TaxID=407234 RepID=UPI00097123A0